MTWLLLLHIAALLCWCGSLLYLPALITSHEQAFANGNFPVTRNVYTHLATPAALLAIVSGTALFLVEQLVAAWLVVKLTLVMGLVICHALTGWLILYVEKAPRKRGLLLCLLLGSTAAALMVAIIWLVLAKPF